jgi:dTDP-4-dehydrorhamnose reductase
MANTSTDIKYQYCRPEIWGGLECTVNRVNNHYRDQLEATGHYSRPDDIDAIAALGIRKLRYPVLWENHTPGLDGNIDWQGTEARLNALRSNGIEVIAGLLHHGSGPPHTNLLDEKFAEGLAVYAGKVAAKFPWINYYTPVNEPLTTARFSGLYGFWYPHHKNEVSFFKMLITQLKGTVLAMQAIRKINPQAQLVQTEDLSKTHSTPLLHYQASYENRRRWLTADFLCGNVDRDHYFWGYLVQLGIPEKDLQFFLDNSCAPDILGFNYYVTSERYLDEHLENYPACTHGGNGRIRYADTEAVRAGHPAGLEQLLKEAWERFHIPMAITECHLNCTREEQLRWFKEIWDTCCSLNDQKVQVKAMTAWSLLGSYDWNSLLTCQDNHYESGVFDIRNANRRPTALAKMIMSIANSGNYLHPVLDGPGWWKKPGLPQSRHGIHNSIPLLITGKTGTLGQAFMKICDRRSIPYIALTRQDLDITREDQIEDFIDRYKPWAIINTAGYVRVDDAEANKDECFAINSVAPSLLANACKRHGLQFMTFSSDLVFDGNKKTPYHEGDNVNPLNIYGASKAAGEEKVQTIYGAALVIRTSAFFGPWDKYNFVYSVLGSLKSNEPYYIPQGVMISPTYVPDLADASLDLFIDEEKGIWHLSNEGMLTWSDFAMNIAERGGLTKNKLISRPMEEMGWKAKRPAYSVLQSEKGIKLPQLENALDRYFHERMV